MRAVMKMTYCPHCRGMSSARPCANYCTNVMKGCLANQADLNTEWRHLAGGESSNGNNSIHLHIHYTPFYLLCRVTRVFKDTMMQVADHLHGPSGVEDVIRTLPNSISDGMSTLMENMDAVKNKVRVHVVTRIQPRG